MSQSSFLSTDLILSYSVLKHQRYQCSYYSSIEFLDSDLVMQMIMRISHPTTGGKHLLTSVMNGSALVSPHVGNEFLGRVQKLARFMRWTACSVIPQVYEACFNDPSRQFPEASTLFFLWTAVEDLGYSFSCCWRLSICDSAKDESVFFSD